MIPKDRNNVDPSFLIHKAACEIYLADERVLNFYFESSVFIIFFKKENLFLKKKTFIKRY